MLKGSLEKEIQSAIESFINREGIDARLGEPDFMIAERFMDFIPANLNQRSIREIVNAIEDVQIKSEAFTAWKAQYMPDGQEEMQKET